MEVCSLDVEISWLQDWLRLCQRHNGSDSSSASHVCLFGHWGISSIQECPQARSMQRREMWCQCVLFRRKVLLRGWALPDSRHSKLWSDAHGQWLCLFNAMDSRCVQQPVLWVRL